MNRLFWLFCLGLLNLLFSTSSFAWRDLETGTYLTRDPAGFVDGPNLYAYVRQNPWSSFDPEGLKQVQVGFVYVIEAPGQKPYVGKATTVGGRLNLQHPKAAMMKMKGATVKIAPILADAPKNGKWTRSTLSRAQRLGEQQVLDDHGGKGGLLGKGPTQNKINAMSEQKVAKYIDTYNSTVGEFTENPGSKFVNKAQGAVGKGTSAIGWMGTGITTLGLVQQYSLAKELDVSMATLDRIASWTSAQEMVLSAKDTSKISHVMVNRATGRASTLSHEDNPNVGSLSWDYDMYSWDNESGMLEDVTYQRSEKYRQEREALPEEKEK